jgi:hypothetical protein
MPWLADEVRGIATHSANCLTGRLEAFPFAPDRMENSMPSRQQDRDVLSSELDAIAQAASRRLHAQAAQDANGLKAASRDVVEAAGAAIVAGLPLAVVAAAERRGEEQARAQVRPDALKRVERTARRAREATAEYEQTVAHAAGLALPVREIAGAAGISHATVRALAERLNGAPGTAGQRSSDPAIDTAEAP